MSTIPATVAKPRRYAGARRSAGARQSAGAWACLALLALAVVTRTAMLPTTPPAPVEARRALASLDAALGEGWPAAPESPLLLVGNALLFTLAGPGNGIARALPALAGIATVALPLLWWRQPRGVYGLGKVGVLSAAGLSIISPLALFAARRVGSAPLGALGAGLIVTLLILSATGERTAGRWKERTLIAGAALGLIGGPTFYDVLIPGLLAWFLVQGRRLPRPVEAPWRPALVGGAIALLVSLAFGLRWSGWSGLADGAVAWLNSWRGSFTARRTALALLTLYEPLLLAMWLAGAGLLWGVAPQRASDADGAGKSRRPALSALAIWGMLSLALNVLRPGSNAESLSASIIPLSLLGGFGAQRLVDSVSPESRRWVALHTLVAFLLWLPGLLAVAQHAGGFAYTDQTVLVIIGGAVLIALQVLLVLLFSLRVPPSEVRCSTFFGGAAILLLLQTSFALGLAYVRPTSPVEPAITIATSKDIAYLRSALHDIAAFRGQRADTLPVVVIEGDADLTAILRWQLREFTALQLSPTWPPDPGALVITPQDGSLPMPQDPQIWRGMSFVALSTHEGPTPRCSRLIPPQCSTALRWYLYRTTPAADRSSNVILWQSETGARW